MRTAIGPLTSRDLKILACVTIFVHAVVMGAALRDPARSMEEDSQGYLVLATNLAADGHFARVVRTGAGQDETWRPELARTPLYPATIATLDRFTSHRRAAIVVVQNALTITLTLFAALIAARAWGRRAGLATGYLLAVDLQGLALSSMILTETIYGSTLFACAWFTARLMKRPTWRSAFATGALVGVTALIRPTSFALPLVLGAAVACSPWASHRRRALVCGCAFALAGILVIGAWTIRNGRVCGEYTLSSVARYNLLACHAAGALARATGVDDQKAIDELCLAARTTEQRLRYFPLSDEANAAIRTVAFDTIRAHPAAFAKDFTLRTINMVAGPEKHALTVLGLPWISFGQLNPTLGRPSPHPIVSWIVLIAQVMYLAVIYVLIGRAAYQFWRVPEASPLVAAAAICAVYLLLLSSGAPGDPRMRWPAIPLLVMIGTSSLASERARDVSTASKAPRSGPRPENLSATPWPDVHVSARSSVSVRVL